MELVKQDVRLGQPLPVGAIASGSPWTQIVFYGLPWLEWGQRQMVLFDLGAAALLHLRAGAVPAGLHLPHRRCS
jgi:hypothetical protein